MWLSDSGTFLRRAIGFSGGRRIEISGLRPHILWLRRRGRKSSVYVTKPFVNQNKKVRSDCRTLHAHQCLRQRFRRLSCGARIDPNELRERLPVPGVWNAASLNAACVRFGYFNSCADTRLGNVRERWRDLRNIELASQPSR